MWRVCLDLQKITGDCVSLGFTAWSVHKHQDCRPSEAQPKYRSISAPSSTHKDRWRDTCSCINSPFPVLFSSSRHSCTLPSLAFSEGEFRREQLVCRDAIIWCSEWEAEWTRAGNNSGAVRLWAITGRAPVVPIIPQITTTRPFRKWK